MQVFYQGQWRSIDRNEYNAKCDGKPCISEPGDIVYKAVTNHPDFMRNIGYCVREGDGYYTLDKETCQRWCNAWNALGGEYTWYVKQFELLPDLHSNKHHPKQMQLF